eukprot:255266_1
MEPFSTNNIMNWVKGSYVEVKLGNEWKRGQIMDIYNQDGLDFLLVSLDANIIKEIQTNSINVRSTEKHVFDDEKALETDPEVSIKKKVSVDTEPSIEEKEFIESMVFVELVGISLFRGKYIYDGEVFQHFSNENINIYPNETIGRWEFVKEEDVYYYAPLEDQLPPIQGWKCTQLGISPTPSINLNFSDDDFSQNHFSSHLIMYHKFLPTNENDIGIDIRAARF